MSVRPSVRLLYTNARKQASETHQVHDVVLGGADLEHGDRVGGRAGVGDLAGRHGGHGRHQLRVVARQDVGHGLRARVRVCGGVLVVCAF